MVRKRGKVKIKRDSEGLPIPEKLANGAMEEFRHLQIIMTRADNERMDRMRALAYARSHLIAIPGGYVGSQAYIPCYPQEEDYR